MSLIILNVDEVKRTLSASGGAFVAHDKEVDIVRFAINSGFADIVLDGQVALRVMYQRPGETEVRAQTLTYYDTDGLHNYYDWQLSQSDLAKKGTLTVALCILRTDSEVEEWHTTPCQIRVLDTIHTDDSDEADESITPTVAQRVAVLETMIQRVASGAPIVVANASAMTDTDQIYVLSTDGNWYYHNGTTWVSGGTYGAVATDTTLSQSGIPADAKKTGDELTAIKADLDDISGSTRNLFNIENLASSNIAVSDGISSGTGAHYRNDHIDGIPLDFTFEENTQYVFSFKGRNVTGSGTGTGLTLYVSYTDGSTSTQIQLKNTYTDFTEVSGVSKVGKTVRRALFSYTSGGDNTWELKDFQIEKGFVQTAYMPYKTGADFSIRSEISDMGFIRTMVAKIASDNDNNLIIDKSLFEIGNITINSTGIIYNNSGTRIRTKKSRQIYIPAGYSISIDGCAFYIAYVDSTGIHFNGWISSYTTPVDGYYYMLIKFSTESIITDIDDVLDNILIMPPESIGHMLLPVSANPMRFKPVYDHLFVNDPNESIIIPHESLAHVRLSARMGFNCIEANVAGKTSDGVYIVNHLVSKKFGRYFYSLDNTDLTDVLVSSVTWDYIVQNVRYNSTLPKYRTRPCRLEEFLAECKMQNLIPFVGSDDSDVYAICDEYMGRGNYIAYGASREQQPDGIIYHWKNLSTKADILAYCQSVGKPFIYGMSNIGSFTDSELLDIVQTLHAHGFWIGTSYADNSWYKHAHLGFDMLGALKRINRIHEGNVCNIDSIFGFSGFTYTNATEADGVLTFSADGTLTPIFTANTLSVGGFDLEMHFNGEIIVPTVGKHGILLYTSDGSYPVFACAPIFNGSPAMALTVKSGTVVYDVSYKVSEF